MATFPSAMTALRLLLTLPCRVDSGDRSFSMLKRVKSELRSTISKQRIVDLCLMAATFEVSGGFMGASGGNYPPSFRKLSLVPPF